ncbi:MAG: hypothetical protein AB1657_04590 [Candidatus Micrarchaeota archaeon]
MKWEGVRNVERNEVKELEVFGLLFAPSDGEVPQNFARHRRSDAECCSMSEATQRQSEASYGELHDVKRRAAVV